MPPSAKYDFIFTGAGCAALSLVMRMIKSATFLDKRILLIDKEPKTKNDRTWCFWERGNGFFEDIVDKKWNTISFLSDSFSSDMNIAPYQYKMIRGIDFYRHCFNKIKEQQNIEIHHGDITQVKKHKEGITIHINGETLHFDNAIVFNSVLDKNFPPGTINLLQHFKGWIIEASSAVFNPAVATFMDFRVLQKRGTTFAYMLPFSETRALIEFTLVTKSVLTNDEYDQELENYIKQVLKIDEYKIIEEEFGIIPMTTRKFGARSDNAFNIGTAGGQTKASSGYTFQFIQKQSEMILNCLIERKDLHDAITSSSRFHFYDRVLLDVLDKNRLSGQKVFSTLFKKNKPQQVLKFLDNETTLTEELKIISTLPTIPFLKAAISQL